MSEPVQREQRVAIGGQNEQEGQEGGVSMQPPVFQLQASGDAPPNNGDAAAGGQQQQQGGGDAPAAEPDAAAGGGLPEEWLDHLRLREGDESAVYLDSRGLPTVGVGHLLSATENAQYPVGTEIPQATRDAWLEEDAQEAYDAASDQAATLGVTDQAFINALASVNFQLGTAWNTEHRRTWAFMVAGDWEAAATEAADSAWNTQTPVRVQDFQAALRALAGTETGAGANAGNGNTTALYAGVVTGDDVNVRSGPGTSNDVVDSMNTDQAVEVFEEQSGWVRIGEGRWMSADFVRRSAAPETSERPQARPETVEQAPETETTEAAAPVTETAAPETPIETGVITGDNVNVRVGPGTDNATVGSRLNKDAPVSIFERRDGWVRIGENQWVSADYVAAQSVQGSPIGEGTITGDRVNVRTGPGTDNPTVGNRLNKNTAVTIYERRDGWVRIGEGQWVSGDFVQDASAPVVEAPAPEAESAAPVPQQEATTEERTPASEGAPAAARSVTITGSVGRGGDNAEADVEAIQQLLSDIGFRITVDGGVGKNTIGAIASFQQANGITGDGRVDPNGGTLRMMNSTPDGAFHNTQIQLQEDENAPQLTSTRWTNRSKLTTDTSGEVIPRQHYANMVRLIAQIEIITSNLTGTFNVNSGYRSPYYNSTLNGSAERSNHQFGRAIDISASDYTPTQFKAELKRLIAERKIHNGGIGLYGTFVHYDIDGAREWYG